MPAGASPELRTATRRDLATIEELERATFPDPWPFSAFESEIDSEAPPMLALCDGALAGYICRMLGPEELHITNMAVAPVHRRKGIGAMLLADTLEFAAGKGCRWAYLDVRPSNEAAQRLYEQFGFVEIFRRRKYYIRPQEDGLVMARPVEPLPRESCKPAIKDDVPGKTSDGLV